jgi:putative FmdB family regulatory protein
MPLYEYTCESCNHTFEALHSISELGKKEKCPVCGKPAERKQISLFGKGNIAGSCSSSRFS